ncbi:MAG: hypothetical protein J0H63_03140, partial [Rhizobiales bacterium]|nr:hypothetical protein [Hyphomicrobiales bacterium]
ELGLMAYGHREKGSCDDIELMVPPAAETADAISLAADTLQPKGKTPLSAAVKLAAEDLKYTEEKATVILITDGLETCDADPCALGTALKQSGIDLTVHVVGFGLTADEGKQVACLAENTGGEYFQASNATGLVEALTKTVAQVAEPAPPPEPAPAPAPAVSDKNLKVTATPAPGATFSREVTIRYDVYRATADGHEENAVETSYGDAGGPRFFNLPAGKYVVVASRDLAMAEAPVDVAEGQQATVEVVMNAGTIHERAMLSETVPAPDGVAFLTTDGANRDQTNYGSESTILVNAGAVTAKASLGNAEVTVPVTVVAGETADVDLVLNAGKLTLRGKRTADASDFDEGIAWNVTDAAGETQTTYGGEANLFLAAGDYKVKATLGEAAAELAVTIAAGAALEKDVVVATGKIVGHALFAEGGPTATEGVRFDVLPSEAGADGERKIIATGYGDGASFNLPPAKYVLRASADIALAESGLEAVAGKPLEVAVVLNAGLLAVSAPGADKIELVSPKKDIYGKQAILATGYSEDWQITVPAGDYTVKVTKKDGSEATAPAKLTAGERTEVSVP